MTLLQLSCPACAWGWHSIHHHHQRHHHHSSYRLPSVCNRKRHEWLQPDSRQQPASLFDCTAVTVCQAVQRVLLQHFVTAEHTPSHPLSHMFVPSMQVESRKRSRAVSAAAASAEEVPAGHNPPAAPAAAPPSTTTQQRGSSGCMAAPTGSSLSGGTKVCVGQ
jgi:hypothetical protein